MDALKFIEERNRMCKSFGGCCDDCPADKNTCCDAFEWQKELVALVEEWSTAHPRKTRQDVFMAHYPDAALNDGVLRICPRNVYKPAKINCNITTCYLCKRAFWLQEAE